MNFKNVTSSNEYLVLIVSNKAANYGQEGPGRYVGAANTKQVPMS
jgi:hypothetical protein